MGRFLPFAAFWTTTLHRAIMLQCDRQESGNSGRSAHYSRLFENQSKRTVTIHSDRLYLPQRRLRRKFLLDAATRSCKSSQRRDSRRCSNRNSPSRQSVVNIRAVASTMQAVAPPVQSIRTPAAIGKTAEPTKFPT